MSAPDEDVRRNLDTQCQVGNELEELLRREREAILGRQWPELMAISRDKERCVARLQSLHGELGRLAGNRPVPEWLASRGLQEASDTLAGLATRLASRNRESRNLLDQQQQRVGAALRLLGGGSPAPALYGPRGFGRTAPPRRSWAAA